MKRPIRVLIADDHAVVREGARQVLGNAHEFDIVGEAASADEAVARAAELHPDVVVLDLRMPGAAGVETIRRVRAASPTSRVVIFSMHDDDEYVTESLRVGASGYVSKDAPPAELRDAIRAVDRGEVHRPRPRARKAPPPRSGARAETGRLGALTPRELDVLRNVAAGRTNKEIAARLAIGTRTVESHRESLMQKLGVRHVAGLIRLTARIAGKLREPVQADAAFDARVMSAVRAAARQQPGAAKARWRSWWTRRSVQLTPIAALALAAGIAAIAVFAARSVSRVPPAPTASADTVHLVRFILADSSARQVALVGTFNQWQKQATLLDPAGEPGLWTVTVSLPVGRHEYAFVVTDAGGQRWVADPFGQRVRDEFGVESSVVSVVTPTT